MTVAALYVEHGGAYYGLPGVEPWGLPERDAREYAGPWPVVCHPPCARWCQLAGLVEAVHGHKVGDDGGTFAAALAAVRRWGGVLEHPAYSKAWPAHGLNAPPTGGGWVCADFAGGWTCHVEQAQYGHAARKSTWLLAYGLRPPSMRWGRCPDDAVVAKISDFRQAKKGEARARLRGHEASATPEPFRAVLLEMARSARR